MIVLIEMGYCEDTYNEKKREEKRLQHAILETQLEQLGFSVGYYITLGHGEAVFTQRRF